MKAIATAPGWTIDVASPSQQREWCFDVAITDSRLAVEAVKKLQSFPKDARFTVKAQLTAEQAKALKLKDGQAKARPGTASAGASK